MKFFSSLILALAMSSVLAQDAAQATLPSVPLQAGMHVIEVEVAQTPEQRQMGLMLRKSMDDRKGMLFVFDQPATQCFWMKNTLIPLTIAFVADDGTIVNLRDMKPQDLSSLCSDKPVRYALEMNKGWFAKRNIKAGFKLKGAPFQPPK